VKILIAGTGGVGGYYGARLLEAGHDVWFLARGQNLEALRLWGLTVRTEHGDARFNSVCATSKGAEAGPVEAMLFCVKTYDNESTALAVQGAVGDGTIVCSLQNGVGSEDFLSRSFPQAVVLGGVARLEAWLESPAVVVQRGPQTDLTVGGFRDEDWPSAAKLADAFSGTATPVTVADDILAALWFKLLGICGVGGVTAYCRCPIGEVRQDERLRPLLVSIFEEVAAVAMARQIDMPPDPAGIVLAYVDNVLDPKLKSSMCRDVEQGRPLEIESLNGAVVRFGAELGIPTPANQRIVDALLPLHRAALKRRAG
jgi:2-dehydropantoate 2-reductase